MAEKLQSTEKLDALVLQMLAGAKISLEKKEYTTTVNCYEVGAQFEPRVRELYLYGGKAYFFIKNYKKASAILKKAKELSDTVQEKEEVFEIFIPALMNIGNYESALENSSERVKDIKPRNPKNASIYYTHAMILYNLGKFSESQKCLLQSLKENSDFGRAWYLLGMNFLKMNKPGNSLKAFEKAVNTGFNNLDLIYHLAVSYALLDRKDASLRVLGVCIKKDQKYRTLARETPAFSKFISDQAFAKLTAPSATTMVRKRDTKRVNR